MSQAWHACDSVLEQGKRDAGAGVRDEFRRVGRRSRPRVATVVRKVPEATSRNPSAKPKILGAIRGIYNDNGRSLRKLQALRFNKEIALRDVLNLHEDLDDGGAA